MKKVKLSNQEVLTLFREKFAYRYIANSNVKYLFSCDDQMGGTAEISACIGLLTNLSDDEYLALMATTLMARVREFKLKKKTIRELKTVLSYLIREMRFKKNNNKKIIRRKK